MSRLHCVSLIATFILTLAIIGCGAGSSLRGAAEPGGSVLPQYLTESQWPAALPQDAAQPWEQRDAQGRVPVAPHGASDADAGAEFAAGVERFSESPAGVSDNLSAAHMESGTPGAQQAATETTRAIAISRVRGPMRRSIKNRAVPTNAA